MQLSTKQLVLIALLIGTFFNLSISLTESASAEGSRFKTLENGTVRDNQTGLIWAALDNGADVNWSAAKEYCNSYSGGGHEDWRMPSPEELATLYGGGKKEKHKDYSLSIFVVTKAIKLTAPWIWSSRRSPKNESIAYGFNYGTTRKLHRGSGINRRALPVRSVAKKAATQ